LVPSRDKIFYGWQHIFLPIVLFVAKILVFGHFFIFIFQNFADLKIYAKYSKK